MHVAEKLLELFTDDSLAQWYLNIVRDMRAICDEFVKHRFENQLRHQTALAEEIFGEMKPSARNRLGTPLVPTSVPRSVPLEELGQGEEETGWEGQGRRLTESLGRSAASSPSIPGENSIIWNQLFGDGSPPMLWTPSPGEM